MNSSLYNILIIWGISSIITILGCFLEPRLKYPDANPGREYTIQECAFFLAVAPFSAFITVIAFFVYLCNWVHFFWNNIKDIEL